MAQQDPDACRVWELLVKVFFAHRGQLPSCSAASDLSPIQCHVLHLIEPERPLPMSRLASALSCDASNVTGLVDRLESRGLVRRAPSSGDRRVKVLELTAAGTRLRGQLLRQLAGRSHPLSRLSPVQRRTLVALLEQLVDERAS
jgi:MarR family transcriptional regulator, organic hydroperoxide resistance regulator